jgi:hypothetical protein
VTTTSTGGGNGGAARGSACRIHGRSGGGGRWGGTREGMRNWPAGSQTAHLRRLQPRRLGGCRCGGWARWWAARAELVRNGAGVDGEGELEGRRRVRRCAEWQVVGDDDAAAGWARAARWARPGTRRLTDMTRGRRSGVGDGRGTSSSCRQA